MRAKNQVIAAGALTIPLPAQNCRIARLTDDPTASWVGENALIPDTSMEIGAVDFFAHKLTCLIKISRELLQDAGNAANLIMTGIANAMATELDSACLLGNGNGQPLGIFNTVGINSYSLGANGATLSGYDDLLYGIREIVNVNGPVPTSAIMSPRTLVDYGLMKDGEGLPLQKGDMVKNLAFYDTTKIPNDQVVGTSSDCSSIILGSFNQLVIGLE